MLADAMASASVCLGIFGDTEKTQRVIPNKVYEALAIGKPIITADTPAIRELLSEEAAMLVPAANPRAIADAILALRAEPARRERLANAGAEIFQNRLRARQIVGDLLEKLNLGTISV